ncbi:MAG TPA: DUF433 domain-containing protein [Bryobacteraceae bacterium]|nr:DUF433 domain-containing protein [Bryobacteraceae bacterium]
MESQSSAGPVPVELLLRKLAEGATVQDLLDAYPRLTAEDIWAALAYAAKTYAALPHFVGIADLG